MNLTYHVKICNRFMKLSKVIKCFLPVSISNCNNKKKKSICQQSNNLQYDSMQTLGNIAARLNLLNQQSVTMQEGREKVRYFVR